MKKVVAIALAISLFAGTSVYASSSAQMPKAEVKPVFAAEAGKDTQNQYLWASLATKVTSYATKAYQVATATYQAFPAADKAIFSNWFIKSEPVQGGQEVEKIFDK